MDKQITLVIYSLSCKNKNQTRNQCVSSNSLLFLYVRLLFYLSGVVLSIERPSPPSIDKEPTEEGLGQEKEAENWPRVLQT